MPRRASACGLPFRVHSLSGSLPIPPAASVLKISPPSGIHPGRRSLTTADQIRVPHTEGGVAMTFNRLAAVALISLTTAAAAFSADFVDVPGSRDTKYPTEITGPFGTGPVTMKLTGAA